MVEYPLSTVQSSANQLEEEFQSRFFAVRYALYIHPDVYNKDFLKKTIPYRITFKQYNFKNSSHEIECSCVCVSTGIVLMKRKIKAVLVNIETRRPASVPDWYKRKMEVMTPFREKSLPPISIPYSATEIDKFNIRITSVLTDLNGHMSHSSYLRLAQSSIKRIPHLSRFNITKLSIDYKKESVLGENLQCRILKDKFNQVKLYAKYCVENEELCICEIEVFNTSLLSNL